MRVVYISYINEDVRPGYARKVHSQSKSFFNASFDTYLIRRGNEGFSVIHHTIDGEKAVDEHPVNTNGVGISKYINYISSLTRFFKYCYSQVIALEADVVYVRRVRPITPMMIRLLRKLKKRGVLVLYEYPTYPWKNELIINKQYVTYAIDSVLYGSLLKSINAMVCVGGVCDEKRCDVVRVFNGIEAEILKSSNPIQKTESNDLRLTCVCHYSPVHGIEKVIDGLEEYYRVHRDKTVTLSLVGPEEEFSAIKTIVDSKRIKDYVLFRGFVPSDKLDEVYSNSDIGIDAIALEIRGEECICGSLKSREYISRGLPIVCSDMLDIIYRKEDVPEFMYVLDHNKPYLDIESLVDWYSGIQSTTDDIREYGKENLTWDITMKPVMDYCSSRIRERSNHHSSNG